MRTIPINDNWKFRPKVDVPFYEETPETMTVCLPHDAVIHTSRSKDTDSGTHKAFFQNGVWEYTKKLFIDESYTNKHVMFLFEGVQNQAMIYINGYHAAHHPYGYTEFLVDADRYLRYGKDNELKVIVRTANDTRWYSGAGLYRPVTMLVSEESFIPPYGVKITTQDVRENQAVILVETTVRHDGTESAKTFRLHTEICSGDGSPVASDTAPVTVYRSEEIVVRRRLYVKKPELWNTDSPSLYICKTRLSDGETVVDICEDTFGIRMLQLDTENGLQINGRSVKLRGACIHHDNGILGAATIGQAEYRRVERLKAAGFNAIRMAHHPASRALLDACDRLGVLIMDEAFDVWTDSKRPFDYTISFQEWWERDIASMVAKDYNHPSVVMYSIGNEIFETGNPHGSIIGRRITDKIKSLDNSRFTTNCINGMLSVMDRLREQMAEHEKQMDDKDINQAMTDIGDRIAEVMRMPLIGEATEESFSCVDIAGYNYMHGRYEEDKTLYPGRVIVGSETHPNNIDRNWRLVMDNGHVIGDFTWTGWDYIGEVGIGRVAYNAVGSLEHMADYPWLTAWCGDIDILGNRRSISYYREIVFGLRKDPYIAVYKPEHYHDTPEYMHWSWTDTVSNWSWIGFKGKPIKIEVYSDADEVELLLNGKSVGKAAAGEKNRYKAIFDITYSPGTLEAVAYCAGKETGRHQLQSADEDMILSLQAEQSEISAEDTDLAFFNIALTDSNDTVHVCSDRKITIDIQGPGELAGFGSANPMNTESFGETSHSTYYGQALAIVRPTGTGEIRVKASADGCADVQTVVLVK